MASESMKNFERMTEKKRHNKETHPEKGTRNYNRNEKIINNNPALKKARDVAQGLQKPDSAYSSSAGKGSTYRQGDYSQQYKDNWERIFGNKDKKNKPDPGPDPYDNDEYSRSHDDD